MKNCSKSVFAVLGIAMIMAGCGEKKASDGVVTLDLEAATSTEPFSRLKVTDVTGVSLDTTAMALFSESGKIAGVVGDTLLIHDRNNQEDRLILFKLSDGRYIGQINHMGQGPGEYPWIEAVFVDAPAAEVVIKSPNNRAYRYTLGDSLVESYSYNIHSNKRLAIGSLDRGIALHEETESGFKIHQLDRNFRQIDTIIVNDYQIGWQAGVFMDFGDEAVVSMADTLYALRPGRMEKLAILHRGGKTILPDVEREMNSIRDYDIVRKMQDEYIMLGYMYTDGDIAMVSDYYGDSTGLDFFRMSDGEHLGRFMIDWNNMAESGIPIETDSRTVYARPSYASVGRWYAIVPDEETEDVSVVSFGLVAE